MALLAYLMCERHIAFDDGGGELGACWLGRGGILPSGDFWLRKWTMGNKRELWICVLTDVQFWVPVLVLVAGLVLLGAIR